MAVQRRENLLSQQRVDSSDLRSIESAVSNDFDQYIQSFITGTSQGYVIRGFEISMANAIGNASNSLQVLVDPGALLHISASQSGTFFLVPSGTQPEQLNGATNTNVTGAFVPSATNYVGLDYQRFNDPTTNVQKQLWDPTTNSEDAVVAPAATILKYQFVITTTPWANNVLPIAIVTTDSGNNVLSITDSRNLLFRLGTGGANPNPFYVYPWDAQPEGRTENPPTTTTNTSNPFEGGDKMLSNFKDWADAVMTSFLEIKGTTYWYSTGTAGSLASLREDGINTVVSGNSVISHSQTVAGRLNWASSPTSGTGQLYLRVIGSQLSYQIAENPSGSSVTLANNEVAYINLNRDIAITPNLIFTQSSATVSSVGNISWTAGLYSVNANGYGDWIKLASDTHAGYYQIQDIVNSYTVTLTEVYGEPSTNPITGAQAVYAYGVYTLPGQTSTIRDMQIADRASVPITKDLVWLFFRTDDGGATPRVYVRFLGEELQQGESRDISDGEWDQIRSYIGMPTVVATNPLYVQALSTYQGSLAVDIPQITQITTGAGATVTSSQYFLIYSSANARIYYVWFKVDGSGSDPMVPLTNASIEVDILSSDTDAQVATKLATAMNNILPFKDFSASALANIVTVTNNSAGSCENAVNFNVGAPFAISVTQVGTGTGNFVVNDGDSLTLAIKKLDGAVGNIILALDSPTYDETVDIVASGATPPTSLNGPVLSGTDITLPNNSRESNVAQYYTVGKGTLEVYLNGQYLRLRDSDDNTNSDWEEVGALGSASNQIQILRDLEIGDKLEFRITGGGGGAGGGGSEGPPGPPGIQGPPGHDAAGGPVAISTKNASYAVALSDNVLLADCSSGTVVFTLPPVASGTGHIFYFKKIDSTTNAMVIQGNLTDLIDGSNTQMTTVQYESFTLVTDGASWWII